MVRIMAAMVFLFLATLAHGQQPAPFAEGKLINPSFASSPAGEFKVEMASGYVELTFDDASLYAKAWGLRNRTVQVKGEWKQAHVSFRGERTYLKVGSIDER